MEVLGGLGEGYKEICHLSDCECMDGMEKFTGGELSEYSTVLQTRETAVET